MSNKIIHKRSSVVTENGTPKIPTSDHLEYGEIAINYASGVETLSMKNADNEIVTLPFKSVIVDQEISAESTNAVSNKAVTTVINEVEEVVAGALTDLDERVLTLEAKPSVTKVSDLVNDLEYVTSSEINERFNLMSSSTELSFFCIEPVTVVVNDTELNYAAGSNVTVTFKNGDTFTILPTSDKSIYSLNAYPGAIGEFYPWLEGVMIFNNILFDMNDLAMYEKWNQGNQGAYHVQYAQYTNCVFWSDNPYISDVDRRPNYTLYYSSEMPLCYSTIPDNTFKAFYCAYNVTKDPNWASQTYKDSFAKATHATQVFSYYGLHSIGMFDMDSSAFNIVLPKDCRGLMFCARNVLHVGVLDATNTNNFGAKSGSWRDAFGYCDQLKDLYIKNLKTSINVSWSPLSLDSLSFIIDNAANTSAITISLSPYTYHHLTTAVKNAAQAKNINLELISTNYSDDARFSTMATKEELTEALAGKQDTISDLADIRQGAQHGSTALQEVPAEYAKIVDVETMINNAITVTLNTEV